MSTKLTPQNFGATTSATPIVTAPTGATSATPPPTGGNAPTPALPGEGVPMAPIDPASLLPANPPLGPSENTDQELRNEVQAADDAKALALRNAAETATGVEHDQAIDYLRSFGDCDVLYGGVQSLVTIARSRGNASGATPQKKEVLNSFADSLAKWLGQTLPDDIDLPASPANP